MASVPAGQAVYNPGGSVDAAAPPPGAPEAGPAPASGSGVSRVLYRYRYTLMSLAAIVIVIAAWQASADEGWIREQLTSSPLGVVNAFRELVSNGTLGPAVATSAKLFGVGLGISIVIGCVGGVLIGWSRVIGAVFEPFIAMLYAMPIVALLPVLLVWFGITFKAQVVMVILTSVFPILVSAMTGTRQVDPELLKLARSLRASQLTILRTIVLPFLVPYLVAGIRLAVGGALIGVVVAAEYFLGQAGIGGLIVNAGEVLKIGQVFVGVFILAFVSVIITTLLKAAERRLTRWR